jgi:hypothetical protein
MQPDKRRSLTGFSNPVWIISDGNGIFFQDKKAKGKIKKEKWKKKAGFLVE